MSVSNRISTTLVETVIAIGFSVVCVWLVRGDLMNSWVQRSPDRAAEFAGPNRTSSFRLSSDQRDPTGLSLGVHDELRNLIREHATPVADYTMRVSLDPKIHVVHGTGTIQWTNRSQASVRELYVHLYLNAFKNTSSLFMSSWRVRAARELDGMQEFGAIDVKRLCIREMGGQNLWPLAEPANGSAPEDQTDMRLRLPSEVEAGQVLHIDMEWEATLPSIVARTGFHESFHMVGQWFPKLAKLEEDGSFAHFPFHALSEFYSDFGTYDVTIDVPEFFAIAATGRRVSQNVAAGRRTERFVQGDIHDFAFAAYDHFVVIERQADGVTVRCFVPEGFERIGHEELEAAAFGLRYFGGAFGRYPYEILTIVHPPNGAGRAGGMEYPTLITTGGSWYFPRNVGFIRAVTIHELGHQYFYGLVATNEQRWPFLDEGLNSYADGLALDAGWSGSVLRLPGLTVDDSALTRLFYSEHENSEPIAQAADRFASARHYFGLVYGRSAQVLETLDNVYGPGAVRQALARYARGYRFAHPSPKELFDAVLVTAGAQAQANLQVALFDRGWVDFAIDSLHCHPNAEPSGFFDRPNGREKISPASAATHGHRCVAVVVRRGTLKFPVDIDLIADDGATVTEHWDGEDDAVTLQHVGAKPVVTAVVDPQHKVMLDSDFANNAVSSTAGRHCWRVLERSAYLVELALTALMP